MNDGDCGALFTEIDEAFSVLREVILEKVSSKTSERDIGDTRYNEAIGLLTIEKSELESKLTLEKKQCERWRSVCKDIVLKLDHTMKSMSIILENRTGADKTSLGDIEHAEY